MGRGGDWRRPLIASAVSDLRLVQDARRSALQAKLTQDAILKAAIGAPLDNDDAIDGMLDEKDKLDDWNTKHQLEAGAAANSMLGEHNPTDPLQTHCRPTDQLTN